MEVYRKVKDFLCDHVGNMTTPGTPRFNPETDMWHVPVLCKTKKGLFIVGEICLNKEEEFVRIPTKEDMLKVLDIETGKVPFLVYAEEGELEEKHISAVTI
jgi:hypothetical protein